MNEPLPDHVELFAGKVTKIMKSPEGWEYAARVGDHEVVNIIALRWDVKSSGLPDAQILLATEYRPPVGSLVTSLPGGKVDSGELPIVAAMRELREETGFEARTWNYAGQVSSSAGITDETPHIFIAKDLDVVSGKIGVGDEDIDLSWHSVTHTGWIESMSKKKFLDPRVFVGIYLAKRFLNL